MSADKTPEQPCCCPAETEPEIDVELMSMCCSSSPALACCAGVEGATQLPPLNGATEQRFMAYMNTAMSEGALSIQQKELITIALSLLAKCEPCVQMHVKQARELGCSETEITEALWLAVAMGGAPILAFYNHLRDGG